MLYWERPLVRKSRILLKQSRFVRSDFFHLVLFGIIVHWIFNGDGDAAQHDDNKHEIVKMS